MRKLERLESSIVILGENLNCIGEEIKNEEKIHPGSDWQISLIDFWNREYKIYLDLVEELRFKRKVPMEHIIKTESKKGDYRFPLIYS